MRVLVLGGTGAMGYYVCSALSDLGCKVTVTSRRDRSSENPNVVFIKGNAHDQSFLKTLLSETKWDAIIDFMIWTSSEFQHRYKDFLKATKQYIFTSSYRVYANAPIIREDSPRLLDVVEDPSYLSTDEYALAKARCENLLILSGASNWTIVRPAVTYDGQTGRFQLTVLEAETWAWRASKGIPVPLPSELLDKQTTMSWGGDVAKMIVRLVGNPHSFGEIYTVSNSEHISWREVSQIYQTVLPSLRIVPCGLSEFEHLNGVVYQIRYDRMFNRIIDNSKILSATGMLPSDLKSMHEGIRQEFAQWIVSGGSRLQKAGVQARLDRLIGQNKSLLPLLRDGGMLAVMKYAVRWFQ